MKIINIPVDSVADPVGAGKRRFDPVNSVKATHRVFCFEIKKAQKTMKLSHLSVKMQLMMLL